MAGIKLQQVQDAANWNYSVPAGGVSLAFYPGNVLVNGYTFSIFGTVLDTVAVVQQTSIPAVIMGFSTAGYYAAGDGGGANYVRTGAAANGTIQSLDGAYWQISFANEQTPLQFGCKGDGVTDDKTNMIAAMTAATQFKFTLDGRGKVYAIGGDMQLTLNDLNAQNLAFLQLTPNNASRRTLYLANCQRLRLKNILVNRNGNGTYGFVTTSAGIWITGGAGHVCEGLYATGNDKGSGVVISLTTDSHYFTLYGNDMAYVDAAAVDDQLQGVWCDQNTDCTFTDVHGFNLSGNAAAMPATRFTRGIVASGNVRCSWVNVNGHNIDQGFDVTGGGGNVDCTVTGGTFANVSNWGVKLANSAVRVTVSNIVVNGSGIAGFVASGPTGAGLTNITSDCKFVGCTSINAGGVASGVVATTAGFAILVGAFNTDYPKGIQFVNCTAIDNQDVPTMSYGFRNEVVYAAGSRMNELIGECRSYGHITAPSIGMNTPACAITGSGTQSIPNNASTSINWDQESYDYAAMHSTAATIDLVRIPVAGFYLVTANAVFAANAVGTRQLNILKNGGAIAGGVFGPVPAPAAGVCQVSGSVTVYMTPADTIRAEVTQTSGGALNLTLGSSALSATLVKAIGPT